MMEEMVYKTARENMISICLQINEGHKGIRADTWNDHGNRDNGDALGHWGYRRSAVCPGVGLHASFGADTPG
jgi:hypothetical protein